MGNLTKTLYRTLKGLVKNDPLKEIQKREIYLASLTAKIKDAGFITSASRQVDAIRRENRSVYDELLERQKEERESFTLKAINDDVAICESILKANNIKF